MCSCVCPECAEVDMSFIESIQSAMGVDDGTKRRVPPAACALAANKTARFLGCGPPAIERHIRDYITQGEQSTVSRERTGHTSKQIAIPRQELVHDMTLLNGRSLQDHRAEIVRYLGAESFHLALALIDALRIFD